jgi:hypothetical protein
MLDNIATTTAGKIHEDSITWSNDGKSFAIVNTQRFKDYTLPKYLNNIKHKSFMRQLNMYGFVRVTTNDHQKGSVYHHPAFIRDNRNLSQRMIRQKIKGTGKPRPKR